MVAQKFSAISLNYRPKNGITQLEISKIIKFLTEKCLDYEAITEKVGEDPTTRHLHACLFFDEPVALGDIFGKTKRWGKLMLPEIEKSNSIWRRTVIVKGVYNDDWLSVYLRKDPERVVLNKCEIPMEIRLTYYSDIESREKTQGPADKYFSWIEELWYEYNEAPPINIQVCSDFLAKMMYSERKIQCIQDPRQMKQKSRTLYSYINKKTKYDYHSHITLEDVPQCQCDCHDM